MTAHHESFAPRPAALDGWPWGLPEPEISVAFNQQHQLVTIVTVPGMQPSSIEIRTGDNGPGDHEIRALVGDLSDGLPLHITQQVEDWAGKKHVELTRMLEKELRHGFSAARTTAHVTGVSKRISDEDLAAMVGHARSTVAQAREDYELATTALIARTVLKDHHAADYIGLMVEGGDHPDFVSGVIVYDADHNNIGEYLDDGEYFAEDDTYEGEGVVEYLPELTADPRTAYWAVLNKGGIADPWYTIDLRKAADWRPCSA